MQINLKKVLVVLSLTIFSEFIFVGCSSKSETVLTGIEETPQQPSIIISQYDPLIREIAEREGLDWCLLSAIAYAESNFTADIRSRAGAVGLMQVMPSVIRHNGYTVEEAYDPKVNIELAVYVLKTLESSFRFGSISEQEKTKIILAGYNSGIGNLMEARKLASSSGVNHNHWDSLKNFGAVNNSETRGFVHKVMKQWDVYKLHDKEFRERMLAHK